MRAALDLQLHHVALTVTDMEKATWFYSEVLGLRPLEFNVDRDTLTR